MELSPRQETTLRCLYRNEVKEFGHLGTIWTHEHEVHRRSVNSLIKLGLVVQALANSVKPAKGYGYPSWMGETHIYRLTEQGKGVVKAISPILLDDEVTFNNELYRVLYWEDDYSKLELSNDKCDRWVHTHRVAKAMEK